MQIISVISGVRPEYEGWLKVDDFKDVTLNPPFTKNSDQLRKVVKHHVDRYMLMAGQSYHLYWTEINPRPIKAIQQRLVKLGIPEYARSGWFNTDVWTIRQVLSNELKSRKGQVYNYRRLKNLELAKYLFKKYQLELSDVLDRPHNLKDQRFKRNFYNAFDLSANDESSVKNAVKVFSVYLLLRNLVSSVPNGCRKMYRKLVPLRVDDLGFDLKLLDYKFGLTHLIQFRNRINSVSGRPFGTAEFTKPYLIKHVKLIHVFNSKLMSRYFNL